MRKQFLKKAVTVMLAGAMALSLTACGGGDKKDDSKKNESNKVSDATLDSIELGKDYTTVKADIKLITHRTDIVDTKFKKYAEDFKKMYPNVNVEFEGITNYADEFITRLTTGNWGDICMIPTSVDKDELGTYFIPLGTKEGLSNIYDGKMLNNYAYGDNVYGLPSMINICGVVYNKAVFAKAGITETPMSPDEFIEDLQKIKDNTDAIPLYTNFAAGWTMTAWDSYIDGCATGDPDFMNEKIVKGKDPFSDRGDGTGPYAVYNTLYQAVSKGLVEEDPTTTDWEGCKGMINNGKIGCMALGSWSIPQMQQAGKNADDIGYMPFPITVNGKQYAASAPDYNYGINCNSSKDNQIASMCFVKYMVEKTGLAQEDGALSVVKGSEEPEVLKDFEGIELVVNNPAPEGEETLFNDVNNVSELGINSSGEVATEIVESAIDGSKSMDDLVKEWNEKWTAAQEAKGVTPQ